MKPSMCGETELHLHESVCDECDELKERMDELEDAQETTNGRVDSLEECCEDVNTTINGHTSSINNLTEIFNNLETEVDGIDLTPFATKTELAGKQNNPPVSSVVLTSTNTAPSYPGTWTLIDKEFKDRALWNKTPSDSDNIVYWLTDAIAEDNESASVVWHNHSILVRLSWDSYLQESDATRQICRIPLTSLGVTYMTFSTDVDYHDVMRALGFFHITNSGNYAYVEIVDWIREASAGNGTWHAEFDVPIPHQWMLDSFCDKFYWERTA